jgi:hypothetical protein
MALGLFLGLAPIGALAQTQTDDTDTQQQEMMQPSESEQSTETEVLQSDDQQATETETLDTDDQQATETEEPEAEPEADVAEEPEAEPEAEVAEEPEAEPEAQVAEEPAEEVIPEQDASELLASTLMGAPVNLADEEIGSVSDLIISEDNTIRGVVVGVGGFLGIGEKRVALPMDRITVQTGEPGEVELATDMTREELEEKEAFKTAAQIQSEQEAEQAQQQLEAQQPVEPAAPQQ